MSYSIKNQEPHFCGGNMFAALEGQQRETMAAVDQYDGNQLLNSSPEDLVAYFVERYKIAPIIFTLLSGRWDSDRFKR